MMKSFDLIDCPLCKSNKFSLWGQENGSNCVRCENCELLYVNPRPDLALVDSTVKLGGHQLEDGAALDTKARRISRKKLASIRELRHLYSDVLSNNKAITWLDVGAGYGEFVEALISTFPDGSAIHGIEPMTHKVLAAKSQGLDIQEGYLSDVDQRYQFISVIDVFSHIPDFTVFLEATKTILTEDGEILIKTGNAAEVGDRRNFPGPLNLPDHLVFGGVSQLTIFLKKAGFEVVTIRSMPIDGLIYSIKNFVKWLIGKPVYLGLPYCSPTRTLWVRAKLLKKEEV